MMQDYSAQGEGQIVKDVLLAELYQFHIYCI